MSNKYIEFNGITFGGKNWVNKQGDVGSTYTPYIITEFYPNEIETSCQHDDLITDGAILSNFRYNVRIVSLRGYILPRKGEDIKILRQQLFIKLNGKKHSKMLYFDGVNEFSCNAVADAPVCGKAVKNSVEFNINFTVPDFFWYENKKTVVAVGGTTKLLKTTFSFPTMFSERVSEATIENENEFAIYPVFTIIAQNVTKDGWITVTNHTTGTQIALSGIDVEDNAVIAVDCKKLTATMNGQSVINYFNDFEDFSLEPGTNVLECVDSNENRSNKIQMEYHRPYVGI